MKYIYTEEILTRILENKDQAFNKLDLESFHVYSFLKEEFENTEDIGTNYLFQFTYRSFYRLDNAGLTPEFKNAYFKLLQDYKNKPIDLRAICMDLYKYKTRKGLNSIQFSFATKLANMLDVNYTIYDSEIIKLFNFSQPYHQKDNVKKIDKYLEQYDYISSTSKELIKNKKIKSIFAEMDDLFGDICKGIGDIKKLDFLMWAIGKNI